MEGWRWKGAGRAWTFGRAALMRPPAQKLRDSFGKVGGLIDPALPKSELGRPLPMEVAAIFIKGALPIDRLALRCAKMALYYIP